jgi:Mrp family chromosome partitioning ATPase
VTKDLFHNESLIDRLDLREFIGAMRVGWRWVLGTAALCLLLMGGYLAVREPSYTARVQLMVYNSKLGIGRDDALFADWQMEPIFLETQIETIRSDKIALNVIKRLGEPAAQPSLLIGPLLSGLKVGRSGLSSVVELKYTSSDPEMAAKVANAFAAAYVEDQEVARAEAAQTASAWLRDRIRDVGPKTRILSPAIAPHHTSSPNSAILLAAATLLGLLLGSGVAIARWLLDYRIRTPEQAASACGVECLGAIPLLDTTKLHRPGSRASDSATGPTGGTRAAGAHDPGQLPPVQDAMQRVLAALDAANKGPAGAVIGITSTMAGEGRSTLAVELARRAASQGGRVLLVDGCAANPTVSSIFAPGRQKGLRELLQGQVELDEVIVKADQGLHVVPAGPGAQSSLVQTKALARLLDLLSEEFDHVICDLPSLTSGAEVRAAAEALPHLLVVIGFATVDTNALMAALATAGPARERLLGCLINKADTAYLNAVPSPLWRHFAKSGDSAAQDAGSKAAMTQQNGRQPANGRGLELTT